MKTKKYVERKEMSESEFINKVKDLSGPSLIYKVTFITILFPYLFYFTEEKSGKEIIKVSDNIIKNKECKYGMYIKRYIPYCAKCIQKYDLIDDCKFIIIC